MNEHKAFFDMTGDIKSDNLGTLRLNVTADFFLQKD